MTPQEMIDALSCPQLDGKDYGKWGSLSIDKKIAIRKLCNDYIKLKDEFDGIKKDNREFALTILVDISNQLWLKYSKPELKDWDVKIPYTVVMDLLNSKIESLRK